MGGVLALAVVGMLALLGGAFLFVLGGSTLNYGLQATGGVAALLGLGLVAWSVIARNRRLPPDDLS